MRRALPSEIVVAGYSKLPQNTSVGQLSSTLAIIVRVDTTTHRVKGVSTTLATDVAQEFVRETLMDTSLVEDPNATVEVIQAAYHGHARRGLIAAFRDLCNRYHSVLEESPDVDHLVGFDAAPPA